MSPEDDPRLNGELRKLRRYLPESTVIIAGGRAAQGSQKTLEDIDALIIQDIQSLPENLEALRSMEKHWGTIGRVFADSLTTNQRSKKQTQKKKVIDSSMTFLFLSI